MTRKEQSSRASRRKNREGGVMDGAPRRPVTP
jgi:hypothetical protein